MFKKTEPIPGLDTVIADLIEKIKETGETDAEYTTLVDQLVKLTNIKAEHAEKPVSRDALVNGAVSLAGILLILNFERAGVVTSKALGFVSKLR